MKSADSAGRRSARRTPAAAPSPVAANEVAREDAEEGLRLAEERSDEVNVFTCLGVLGRLELALGNLDAAGARLRNFPARALALGYNDPTAPFWADAIETLISLGELETALEYLGPYERHAARVGDPWAMAAAARSRGLFAVASDNASGAFEALERALGLLEGARTEWLRRT